MTPDGTVTWATFGDDRCPQGVITRLGPGPPRARSSSTTSIRSGSRSEHQPRFLHERWRGRALDRRDRYDRCDREHAQHQRYLLRGHGLAECRGRPGRRSRARCRPASARFRQPIDDHAQQGHVRDGDGVGQRRHIGPGVYSLTLRVTGTNSAGQPVTRMVPITVAIATASTTNEYVDILGFTTFRIIARQQRRLRLRDLGCTPT